jgi:hypothetical protein
MYLSKYEVLKMKAIPTYYKGFHFRSRQEARWAVFFDYLKIPFEYELEGYVLETGRYLPDFWLPTLDCFFEVKGALPLENEIEKAKQLSIETKKLVALASGQQKTDLYDLGNTKFEWPVDEFQIQLFAGYAHDTWKCKAHNFSLWNFLLDEDLLPFIKDKYPSLNYDFPNLSSQRKQIIECDSDYYERRHGRPHPKYVHGRYIERAYFINPSEGNVMFALEPEDEPSKISKAYKAALSARFEFGQSGT